MKFRQKPIITFGVLIAMAILGIAARDISGQQRSGKPNRNNNISAARSKPRPPKTPQQPDSVSLPVPASYAPTSVSVVNTAVPDFLSGEASVTVNPRQPTVIRLGLAQNAVSIVEFPASDGIYYIHEGNPKLASIFQSPTKESDRSITIYPGESFLPARDGSSPSTAISLQMRSGLVLILELVPVNDIRKNAHRCVIRYNRDDVIAARRTAGLAFDLGEDVKTPPGPTSKAASKLMQGSRGPDDNDAQPKLSGENPALRHQSAIVEVKAGGACKQSSGRKTVAASDQEISLLANKRLADSIRDPKKNFGTWSKQSAGIELAVTKVTEVDAELRLVVIAVRNGTTENLRLLPGSPEIQVQTSDDKGNSLQMERVERRYVESTSLEGLVQPGATVYYTLVYRGPILGSNQNIRVLVSHREAADAPVTLPLSSAETGKE
ncbi:MAG: hypothetical protein AB7L70_18660 [Pyrinomonadaceae bacterium]